MTKKPLHPAQNAEPIPDRAAKGGWLTSVARLAVLLCVLWGMRGQRSGAQSNDAEYQVKAAFLYHFAQLVDWPSDSLPGTDNSMFLCTVGEDPFRGALEGTVEGKAIGSRVIRVRHLRQAQDLQACQILFLGKSEDKRIPILLANLNNAPVLTVGETEGFLGAGGMIAFLLVQNRVRFAVNLGAADSANLKIGSRLLVLAQSVVGVQRGEVSK